jgi:hypothetical protein
MKGLPTIIKDLREAMKYLTDKQKMFALEKIFGEQGGRAALALIKEGEGSWEAIGVSTKKAVDLQEKMNQRLTGFNANLKALKGTAQTSLALMFNPMLTPLSKALSLLNDIAARIGKIMADSPNLAKAVSGGTLAIGAAAGGYGLWSLLRGGIAGGKVLKGLGGIRGLLAGIGGTAAGIAEGKAVQAATGVQPVFVTNWPAGLGLGAAAAPAAGGMLATLGKAGLWGAGLATAGIAIKKLLDKNIEGFTLGRNKDVGGYMRDWLHRDLPNIGNDLKRLGSAAMWPINKQIEQATFGRNKDIGGHLHDIFQTDLPALIKGIKNAFTFNIQIDQTGRPVISNPDMNNEVRVNTLKRGKF